MQLLMNDGDLVLSKVCHEQPLLVEHHCTFIVDISSLPSQKDIKCNGMGAWRNNSSHKYAFSIEFGENGKVGNIAAVNKISSDPSITLNFNYFQLKHDIYDDVRKRIDTIVGKCYYILPVNLVALQKLIQLTYIAQRNA